jgi:hypothetical protein
MSFPACHLAANAAKTTDFPDLQAPMRNQS